MLKEGSAWAYEILSKINPDMEAYRVYKAANPRANLQKDLGGATYKGVPYHVPIKS